MENTTTAEPVTEHPLDKASRLVGGRAELAHPLGVSVAAIGNWKKRGVPIEHCVRIERATGGEVSRRHLRPLDFLDYWPELEQVGATEVRALQGVA